MTDKQAYEMYLRCFPEYPTSLDCFCSVMRPDLATQFCVCEDGAAVGCALVHGNAAAMLCVLPEYRGRGHGGVLLCRAEAHIRAEGHAAVSLGFGPHYLLQGVPELPGGAAPFFERRGYTADWISVNMALPLAGFDPQKLCLPAPPAGLAFRFARAEDRPALLRAVEAAQPDWLDIFRGMPENAPILLAELDGEIAGFEILEPAGGRFVPDGGTGSIGCVGVVPAARNRG
ncbi:MAG: GNAT family N-acetyltransferase, partial [Firmicutes bacterium]|nr:GNAT family N-acetyltransferase [Bacillota bacterium]